MPNQGNDDFGELIVWGVLVPAGLGALVYVVLWGLQTAIVNLAEAITRLTARPAESGGVDQEPQP